MEESNTFHAGPEATVAGGILCISCGYDLRGLPITANCPECGTLIRRSLAGDRLGAAEPNWLRHVMRGQRLVAWGWLTILLIPASFILFLVASIFQVTVLEQFFMTSFRTFAALVGLAGLSMNAVGVVLVTMQDPRESLREPMFSPRQLARAGLIGAFLVHLVSWPVTAMIAVYIDIIRPMLILLILGLLTVGIVSYLRMLTTLLNRVPKPEQASQASALGNFLRWALPLAVVLIWMVPRPGRGRPRPELPWILDIIVGLLGCAGTILWLLLLAKAVTLATLLFHASGAFTRCLKQAIIEDEVQKQLASEKSNEG